MSWTISSAYTKRKSNFPALGEIHYLDPNFLKWVNTLSMREYIKWGTNCWRKNFEEDALECREQALAESNDIEFAETMHKGFRYCEEFVYESNWHYLNENLRNFKNSSETNSYKFFENRDKETFVEHFIRHFKLPEKFYSAEARDYLLEKHYTEEMILRSAHVFFCAEKAVKHPKHIERLKQLKAPDIVIENRKCPPGLNSLRATSDILESTRRLLPFVGFNGRTSTTCISYQSLIDDITDWLGKKEDITRHRARAPGSAYSRQ